MKVGSKSVLFGAHCFFLHPWFVALAWWKLYGFPYDPRLWIAFFVHDLGYWGKPNMDGPEGEKHVNFGARVMRDLFGDEWYRFCLYHSRFYAKLHGQPYSRLCVADKLSFHYTPKWLYLPMVRLSGEVWEYVKEAQSGKYQSMNIGTVDLKQWAADVDAYMTRWAWEHREIKVDTWTPERCE